MKTAPIAPSLAAALATALLAAPPAQAQASAFQGFSAGLGINAIRATTEYDSPVSAPSDNGNDANLQLQLQYALALGDSVVLAIGGSTAIGDAKAGTLGSSDFKLKDAYSVYLAPGLALDNNWLVYGKLAYLNANVSSSAGPSYKFDDGWGYGLGLHAMLTRSWFCQAEYMVNQYTDKHPLPTDTIKLKSSAFSLGVGYRF